jgi:hypothetical protein
MSTCPFLRASLESRKVAARLPLTRDGAGARRWRAALATLVHGMVGWCALRDLLSAIPDSNDDFGLF